MTELRPVEAKLRYVAEYSPKFESVETDNRRLAYKIWDAFGDAYPYHMPEIIDICVNGETFSLADIGVEQKQ